MVISISSQDILYHGDLPVLGSPLLQWPYPPPTTIWLRYMTSAALCGDHTAAIVFTHKHSPFPTSIPSTKPCNSALKLCFSNFTVCQNQLVDLLKTHFRVSDSVGLGGPENFCFHRYPDNTSAAGTGTTLENCSKSHYLAHVMKWWCFTKQNYVLKSYLFFSFLIFYFLI